MVRLSRWMYDRKIDVSEFKILDALHSTLGKNESMGLNKLCRIAGISKRTAWRRLPKLTARGLVKRVLVGKYPKYSITPKGIAHKKTIQHQRRIIDFASSNKAQFMRIEPGEISIDSSASVIWHGTLSQQERLEIKHAYSDFAKKIKKITAENDISLRVIGTLKQKRASLTLQPTVDI